MRRRVALVLLFGLWLRAQDPTPADPAPAEGWTVTHEKAFWRDTEGNFTVHEEGIRYVPASRKPKEVKPVTFAWSDIQQLILTERRVEIVTYHDLLWQLGRDRQFRFELKQGTPETLASMEEKLRAVLGSRLVVALPANAATATPIWELPAKLTGVIRGAEGMIGFTGEELIFSSSRPGQSRRWQVREIETIAQTNPLGFSITAPERALSDQGGYRSFSFQLKQPLKPEQYQQLWRAIERSHGTRLRFRDGQ